MRLQDRYLDDLDDFEDYDDAGSFSFERSAAFNRLLDEHRRDKGKNQHRNFDQARRFKREEWYWDDDDDFDGYLDDIGSRYTEGRQGY